jgi:hypothetical protein
MLIVRLSPDLPAGVVPVDVDGLLLDVGGSAPVRVEAAHLQVVRPDGEVVPVVAVLSDRNEVLADGTVVGVLEVRP